MPKPRRSVRPGVSFALAVPLLASPLLGADATRSWREPVSGVWSDPLQWNASPAPNNGSGGLTYHAVIDAVADSAYTVTQDTPLTLDALTLASPRAVLNVTNELRVVAAPLDVSAGTLWLDGGTVRGGSITLGGSGSLVVSSDNANRFTDGAVVHGDLHLWSAGARVLFQNGAWFTGDAALTGSGATILGVAHDRTLGAGQTVNLNVSGAIFSIEGGSTLTIADGAVVRGRGLIYNGTMGGGPDGHPTLVNRGRISADIPGAELRANPDTFVNNGLIESVNGARLHFFAGVYNDTGGRLRAAGGGRLRIDALSGGLNDTMLEGAGSVMRLNGAGFAINQDLRVGRGTMLILGGTWVLDAALDVGGRAVVDYLPGASPLDAVRAELLAGRNGGTWDGPGGIRSSDAATVPGTALGYVESSELFPLGGTWFGEPVDESAVLIAFARLGDANLDTRVDLADFNRLASRFGQSSGAHWSDGDFNYDGTVNLSDFNLLAASFGLSAAGPDVTPEEWSALAAAVPEPATATALPAMFALLRRRAGFPSGKRRRS